MKHATSPRPAQAGFSMLFVMVAMLVLLVASAAIIRSSGMSLFSSGNLAFKQDMVARSEAINARVYALFRTGGALSSSSTLASDLSAQNYHASVLQANDQGIPLALLDSTKFAAVGIPDNDITDTAGQTTMRYVIERLCDSAGDAQTLGTDHCVATPDPKPTTGGSSTQASYAIPPNFSPIYRVTAKISGPRNSEAYVQSTFLKPN